MLGKSVAKEIRLRVRVDDKGIPLGVAAFGKAGAAAGAAFAAGFNREFRRLGDGTYAPSRTRTPQTAADRILARYGPGAPSARDAALSRLSGTGIDQVDRAVGRLGRSIGFAHDRLSRLALGFAGLGGAIYSIRSVGFALDRYFVAPLQRVGAAFIRANEESRKFEIAVGAIAGQRQARALNRAIVSASVDSPQSVAEIRESALLLARLPAFAGRLNGPSAAGEVQRLNGIISRLAILDPAQGIVGARTSIAELAEGGGGEAFNSLRRRFGLNAQTLARAAGARLEDVKADPQIALRGVENIVKSLLPDSALEQSSNLFTVRIQKLKDGLDSALARVGDEGLFDSLTSRIDHGVRALFKAIDSDRFAQQARRVSDAADRALGRITSSAEKFLRRAVGAGPDDNLLDVVGDGIAHAIERFADLLINLPGVSEQVGRVVGELGVRLGQLVDSLVKIAAAVNDPQSVAARAIDNPLLRVVGTARESVGESGPEAIARQFRLLRADYLDLTGDAAAAQEIRSQIKARLRELDNAAKQTRSTSTNATSPVGTPQPQSTGTQSAPLGRLEQLIRRTDGGDLGNFAAIALALNAPAGRLEELTERERDRLQQIGNAGGAAFDRSAEVIKRLSDKVFDDLGDVQAAISDGQARLAKASSAQERTTLEGMIATAKQQRERIGNAFRETAARVSDTMTDAANNFAAGLSLELADNGLLSDVALRMAQGQTSQIRKALARLEDIGVSAGAVGLAELPLDQQQRFADRLSEKSLATIEGRAAVGDIRVGMSADQIDRLSASRPDDRAIQSAQIRQIEAKLLPLQRAILDQANAGYRDNPDDPLAARNAAAAAEAYAKLSAQLGTLRENIDGLAPAFRDFASSTRDALESNLGDAIGNIIRGTGSLRDALVGFADDVVSAFSKMAANRTLDLLIGSLGQTQQSGQSGGLGGLLGGLLNSIVSHASGGIVDRPELALIGERTDRVPEAVVPMLGRGRSIPLGVDRDGPYAMLPRGRKVRASFDGGRLRAYADGGILGAPVTTLEPRGLYVPDRGSFDVGAASTGDIYVVASLEEAVRMGLRRDRDLIVDIATTNILRGGKLGKAVRSR